MVHSGGSTSPLVMSSGPTTLTYLLDSLARGTHLCVHVHSKWNPTVRSFSNLQRRSFQRFGVSGIGSSCTLHLKLPSAEILKLLFTLPLNRTVNYLPTIYGVDRFGVLGFGGVPLPHFPSPDFAKSERFS
jgi:hypothetical protein